jgi:hypothetical protein
LQNIKSRPVFQLSIRLNNLQKLLESFLDELIDRETHVAANAKEMSHKKSLEEQSTALLKGQTDWLEPCPRLQKSPWLLR